MNAGVAAFRAGNAPDILQVFEVGTATMMYAKGAVKPIQEMSEEAGDAIDPADFLGAVASYYSSSEGKLISMPFNSSTPVLYYAGHWIRHSAYGTGNKYRHRLAPISLV